jgi:acyl-coenzyme A thioesterase PaaI-like protein
MLLKETGLLRLLGLKIPMVLFLGPIVERLDDEESVLRIPLTWRSRNHVGVMYIGALVAGADLVTGLPAAKLIMTGPHRRIELLFTDLKAEFLKRADGDVVFRQRQVREVVAAVEKAEATGERVTVPIEVVATVPKTRGDEPVARFVLSLTLKKREKRPDAAGAPEPHGGGAPRSVAR